MKQKTQHFTPPDLASKDPWRRIKGGAGFAQAIDKKREQDALWLLDDGLILPSSLLHDALCAASIHGMDRLGKRLIQNGAEPRHAAPLDLRLYIEGYALYYPIFKGYDPTYSCGTLALFNGHLEWARDLASIAGQDAFGRNNLGILYSKIALKSKLNGPRKFQALHLLESYMTTSDLSLAANLICLGGGFDCALHMLDTLDTSHSLNVARTMLAPLASYTPNDPQKQLALIVLEQAVTLAGGRQIKSIAPWNPFDLLTLSHNPYHGSKRVELVLTLAESLTSWGQSSKITSNMISPTVAASMSGNQQALDLLSALTPVSDDSQSLKTLAQMSVDFLERKLKFQQMPSLFSMHFEYLHNELPQHFTPLHWARASQALCESIGIEHIVKISDQNRKKRERKERKKNKECTSTVLSSILSSSTKSRNRL